MKNRSSIVMLAILLSGMTVGSAFAQKMEPRKTYTKIVSVSADDAWTELRKLDQVDKYSSTIARVEWSGNMGVGGSRVCYSPDGKGYFKENIVAFDDANRSFTYSLVEGAPIKGMVNTWKVVDLGYQKSMIIWSSNYDQFMENPQMTEEQFMAFIDSSLNEYVGNIVAEAKM